MPNDDVLTLDSALALMAVTPEENAAPFEGDPSEFPPDDDSAARAEPTEEEIAAAPAEDAEPGTEDAPAEPGKTDDADVDQGAALPPIEAPSSWKTEEKAEWAGLSRKAQETILRREQDNTTALRTLQNGTAEQRKLVDAEVGKLKALASQMDVVLNRDVEALSKEFPEIRSEADVVALSQSDPARYSVFQAKLMALNSANASRATAAKELADRSSKADTEAQTAHLAEAKVALIEAFPAWTDLDVAKRETTELQDYAIKLGAPEAAARSTIDPVIYKLAQKAMLYDRAQAARLTSVQRVPPRVVKPGAQSGSPKQAASEDARRTQLGKLDQSGDIEDARGLLRM